jgi:IS5 family transposase
MKQTTFASLAFESKKKLTRRERFLTEMDQVVPWTRLLKLIAPRYPKAGNGRAPMPLETMLRIYFLQQWFNLSDPAAEASLYDIESMRRFCGIELGDHAVPDETTILNFRRLLERHRLTEAIFKSVNKLLLDQRLLLKSGTLVDATIISAPSSTKNEDRERDPEMSQTKKGNQWYFGMKVHIGTDWRGIVHTVTTTTAKEADITQLPELLHGKESVVHGDRGYYSADANAWLKKRGGYARACRSVRLRVTPDRNRESAQPTLVVGAGVRRTSLSHHQAVVGHRQSPLPGPSQEHGPGVRAAGAG